VGKGLIDAEVPEIGADLLQVVVEIPVGSE
jgi:hypothetical protein